VAGAEAAKQAARLQQIEAELEEAFRRWEELESVKGQA
jgi:chaperonin cofactor prefoldin